jgi:hypothetical protein
MRRLRRWPDTMYNKVRCSRWGCAFSHVHVLNMRLILDESTFPSLPVAMHALAVRAGSPVGDMVCRRVWRMQSRSALDLAPSLVALRPLAQRPRRAPGLFLSHPLIPPGVRDMVLFPLGGIRRQGLSSGYALMMQRRRFGSTRHSLWPIPPDAHRGPGRPRASVPKARLSEAGFAHLLELFVLVPSSSTDTCTCPSSLLPKRATSADVRFALTLRLFFPESYSISS